MPGLLNSTETRSANPTMAVRRIPTSGTSGAFTVAYHDTTPSRLARQHHEAFTPGTRTHLRSQRHLLGIYQTR